MAAAQTGVTWEIVKDDSAAWSQTLRQRISTELQTFAQAVLEQAQQDVAVRSGATQESGEIVSTDDLNYMVSFGGAALYLEYGTAFMPAQPFLTPAVADNEANFVNRLAITTQGRITADFGSMTTTPGPGAQ